jgi:phosphatidylglycerol---prolipoprotein diacylglyceryl transferase
MTSLALMASIGWNVLDRFHFGSRFALSPHGLGIAVGFLAGAYVFVNREAPRRGISEEIANSLVFWALVGTIIGSRLAYVITHLSEFHNLGDVLAVYRGGLSQLGGVVGAILACVPLVRRKGLALLKGLDAAAIPIPLGVVIGRIGDLIIGDHLGKPTSWALAFRYFGGNLSGYDCVGGRCTTLLSGGKTQTITAQAATLTGPEGRVLGQGVGVHQTALYDLFIAMALVLFLVFLNQRLRRPGVLFLTYAGWYGAGRILTDFLRVENRFFGLTGSQWTSVAAVALGIGVLVWFALRPLQQPPGDGTGTDGGGATSRPVGLQD